MQQALELRLYENIPQFRDHLQLDRMPDDIRDRAEMSFSSSSSGDEERSVQTGLLSPPPSFLSHPNQRRKSLDLIELKRRLMNELGDTVFDEFYTQIKLMFESEGDSITASQVAPLLLGTAD
jgi:hypothetical protein